MKHTEGTPAEPLHNIEAGLETLAEVFCNWFCYIPNFQIFAGSCGAGGRGAHTGTIVADAIECASVMPVDSSIVQSQPSQLYEVERLFVWPVHSRVSCKSQEEVYT